jgi:hypothetical protein
MDPDVVLTIAFAGYAVVATIAVGFLIAQNGRGFGMDDGGAHLDGARLSSDAYGLGDPRRGRGAV